MAPASSAAATEPALAFPASAVAPRPAPLGTAGVIVVALVTLANLLPLWAFRFFPGQDTANHLYTVEVLRQLLAGPSAFGRYFAPSLGFKSNLLFHVLMLGLLRAVSLTTAHRLILSVYAVVFPLAALSCASNGAPRSRLLALLFLPLVWNWFVVQGLYNYALSLPPALLWLGLLARHGGRPTLRAALAIAGLALLVYLAHVETFLALLLVSGIRVAWPGDGSRTRFASRVATAWPLMLAVVPALAMAAGGAAAGFFHPHAPPDPTVSALEMNDPLFGIATFFIEFAMRYRPWELVLLGPPLVLLLVIPCAAAWRRWRAKGTLASAEAPAWPLYAAGALAVLYLISPHIIFGSDANPRLRPVIVFVLLCYAGVELSLRASRRLLVVAALSGLLGAGALGLEFARLTPDLTDYVSGIPYVRPDSRLYPINFDPRSPSMLVKPFLHAWGYYGIADHVVTPFAFAWHPDRFPIRYLELPVHDAGAALASDAEDEPYALEQGRLCAAARRLAPSVSCDDLRRQTLERLATLGESYDYVLTWAAPPDFDALLEARGYVLVHRQGKMSLYTPPPSLTKGRPEDPMLKSCADALARR
jgi:hypothetical protein